MLGDLPRLDVTGGFNCFRVVFTDDADLFDVLGEFATLGEAHAAYRAARDLTDDLSPISTRDV